MASSTLDEKIVKIRQQNEEISRRHKEVEEDKKNAAKSNALVQMVPSSDWPERKEPPEFSNPPRISHKPKPNKEHSEHSHQHYVGAGEGKKLHAFAQGEGPPPDPKYNFLADFEREERTTSDIRDNGSGRGRGKNTRGNFKKKGSGREGYYKDQKVHHGMYRDDCPPEYDAWRAERNRIDEDRISRQRTAEGNWRREWDNDKAHIVDDVAKRESRSSLGSFIKRDHKEFDRRYHADNNEHSNHNRGNSHRFHQGPIKNYYSNHDHRYNNVYDHGYASPTTPKPPPSSPGADERTVIATDRSLKVTLNQGNPSKGSLMGVKVNLLSIAGTGRVGPRQRSRVTYTSHSDMEGNGQNNAGYLRQKSFEDKTRNVHSNNAQNSHNLRRSYSQRKKESDAKSPYMPKKEFKKDGNSQSPYCPPKSPKAFKMNVKAPRNDHMSPVQQPNDENKEVATDKSINVEQQQKDANEVKNDIVPCESDIRIDSTQKAADIEISGAPNAESSGGGDVLGVTQSENNIQNLKVNEASHREANENDAASSVENDSCTLREDPINDCDNKSEIGNLNESLNSTIHNSAPSDMSVLDSFEKETTGEQCENDNLSLKESKKVTENEKNVNVSQGEAIKLVPDNSSDAKEPIENIKADEIVDAKQPEVIAVVEDTSVSLSAAKTHSVIEADSQQNHNISKSDQILLTESTKQEVDPSEQENSVIMSEDVSESKPNENDKCSPLIKVEAQHTVKIDDQLQRDGKVTENPEVTNIKNEEQNIEANAGENIKVATEEQSDSKTVSDDKSCLSLAAETQSVIEMNKQLDCDNEPVGAQETQELQKIPVAEEGTNKSITEYENAVTSGPSERVTVESDNKCSLSPSIKTNSVIEANNQMKESGDASKSEDSKTESVFPERKEDAVVCASDDKCLETIQNLDENFTNDKAMSGKEGNGAISDNVESQTKCNDISDEIEDNKIKATESVKEDAKE